jgi:hypothetical protein
MTKKTYKLYKPYKSDKPEKKYFVLVQGKRSIKKIYFGAEGYSQFTNTPYYKGHLDWERRQRYEDRHKEREDWGRSGVDSAGFWSYWYLWKYPTYIEAEDKLNKKLKDWGFYVDASVSL